MNLAMKGFSLHTMNTVIGVKEGDQCDLSVILHKTGKMNKIAAARAYAVCLMSRRSGLR